MFGGRETRLRWVVRKQRKRLKVGHETEWRVRLDIKRKDRKNKIKDTLERGKRQTD